MSAGLVIRQLYQSGIHSVLTWGLLFFFDQLGDMIFDKQCQNPKFICSLHIVYLWETKFDKKLPSLKIAACQSHLNSPNKAHQSPRSLEKPPPSWLNQTKKASAPLARPRFSHTDSVFLTWRLMKSGMEGSLRSRTRQIGGSYEFKTFCSNKESFFCRESGSFLPHWARWEDGLSRWSDCCQPQLSDKLASNDLFLPFRSACATFV